MAQFKFTRQANTRQANLPAKHNKLKQLVRQVAQTKVKGTRIFDYNAGALLALIVLNSVYPWLTFLPLSLELSLAVNRLFTALMGLTIVSLIAYECPTRLGLCRASSPRKYGRAQAKAIFVFLLSWAAAFALMHGANAGSVNCVVHSI